MLNSNRDCQTDTLIFNNITTTSCTSVVATTSDNNENDKTENIIDCNVNNGEYELKPSAQRPKRKPLIEYFVDEEDSILESKLSLLVNVVNLHS